MSFSFLISYYATSPLKSCIKGYNPTFFSHDFTKIFYGKCRKPLKLKGFFERNKIRVKKVVAVAFFILSGKMKSVKVSGS